MTANVSTTRTQSRRLLDCGIDPITADMLWHGNCEFPEVRKVDRRLKDYLPAWSLNRLLELLPKEIIVDESPYDDRQKYGLLIYPFMGGWQVDYQYCEDDECHSLTCKHDANIIEACVKAIEWVTSNGYKLNEI